MTRYFGSASLAIRELKALGYRMPGRKAKRKYNLARHEDAKHILMVRSRQKVLDIMKIERATGKVMKLSPALGV